MVNFINYNRLCLLILSCYLANITSLPLERLTKNEKPILHQNKSQLVYTDNYSDNAAHVKIKLNRSDDLLSAAVNYQPQLRSLMPIKPRGFILPKNRPTEEKSSQITESTAQNYYSNYFTDLPFLSHAQPYFPSIHDAIITKLFSQRSKQFQPREQPFSGYDTAILGSGDFGIVRGGTFYSNEQQVSTNGDDTDFYGDASNTHVVSSTEGLIEKYTYPEEQFAQFRDFADLSAPLNSEFSQYTVVYAAKNATRRNHKTSKPRNIFEQLQEIDKEKALEQKIMRKNQKNPNITKLKLVKKKLPKKKWQQKPTENLTDDDPLLALS